MARQAIDEPHSTENSEEPRFFGQPVLDKADGNEPPLRNAPRQQRFILVTGPHGAISGP
jgi:hypothetical protein